MSESLYEEAKFGARYECACGSGGGMLLAVVAMVREHLAEGGCRTVSMTITYDRDPHMVDLDGKELPWPWEVEHD